MSETDNKDCVFCDNPTLRGSGFVWETETSLAVLHFNQETYPGRSIVILKDHYDQMHEVPRDVRIAYEDDVYRYGAALKKAFNADRVNYANLGNVVSHVHTHVFPRTAGDPNEGGPPLFGQAKEEIPPTTYKTIASRIKKELN